MQFKVQFPRMGIEARFVDGDDPDDFERLIDDKTKVSLSRESLSRCCSFIPPSV